MKSKKVLASKAKRVKKSVSTPIPEADTDAIRGNHGKETVATPTWTPPTAQDFTQGRDLSFKAIGVLRYLLGQAPDYVPSVADICAHATDNPGSVEAALLELRRAGYAELRKEEFKGNTVRTFLVFSAMREFTGSAGVMVTIKLNKAPTAQAMEAA